MCTVTINPASISAVPLGANNMLLSLSGTVANCTSNSVTVTLVGPGGPSNHQATISGSSWSGTLETLCPCGSSVKIIVTCNDSTPCSATYNTTLFCNCCPGISATYKEGLCSNGLRLITFKTTVTVPPQCVVSVQRDFGDGTSGVVMTYNSTQTYTETHGYPQNNSLFLSNVNVVSNLTCPPLTHTVNVVNSLCGACSSEPWLALFCMILRLGVVVAGATATALFLAGGTGCGTVSVGAYYAIAAAAALLFILVWCQDCICQWWTKLPGQLLTAFGASFFLFVPPSCSSLSISGWFNPALAIAGVCLFFVGMLWLLRQAWWIGNEDICPLNECDYWDAVAEAMFCAGIATAFIVIAIPTLGTVNLGLALGVIGLVLALAAVMTIINTLFHRC